MAMFVCLSVLNKNPNSWTDHDEIWHRAEAGFLNNFFHESCNFQIKVATLKFLGFLNKAISSEGFNFVAACLNGFFKHFFTP